MAKPSPEAAEESLSTLLRSVTDGVVILDQDWRYAYVNAAAERLLGRSRDELLGRVVWEVFPSELGAAREQESWRAVNDSVPVVLENYWTPTERWLETSIYPLKDEGLIAYFRDVTERKHMEEALRESEQRFRLVTKATNDAIWDIDLKTGTVSWNDTYSVLYGRPPETAGSWQWWIDRIHSEDCERTVGDLRAALASGASGWTCEYRFRRADGGWAHIFDRAYIARDASGSAWRVIGAMQDLTERKHAEAALRESEERFRDLAERLRASEAQLKDAQRLAKVGSWEFHIETAITCWSDENRRILGVPDDAPANFSTFINCVHPQDRETVLESARNVSSTGETRELKYRIIRPDGEVRFVHSVFEALGNDQGKAVRIVGATQDITDQIEATQLLRESEGRLKNAERLGHLGHWNWDAKTNKAVCSEEYCRIYGEPMDYTPSFEDFLNAVIPQDRVRVGQVIRDALAQKTGYTIEYQIARPAGEFRALRSVAELVLDEEGLPERLFGTCQDITDLRRAQEEALARQKLESVGTLASGIAHDFNNLLGGVEAQAELALAELDAGSSCKEELGVIRDAAMRGSEIVRQLMIYSGTESGKIELVDLSNIVDEMLSLLKASVTKRAVIETHLDRDLPAIRASAAQLRQIVLNLITNASDAIGDRDGVIRVITRPGIRKGESAEVSFTTLADGDYVQLDVSDTGRGMSTETQAKVFDPFFTTKAAGRGLGLAVVQGIVRSLGGAIHLTSELDKGTTFQILLPCAEGVTHANGRAVNREKAVAPTQHRTVLVVEDEDPLRRAIVKMLRKTGFEVFEAADGASAIARLRADGDKVDVMLLDLSIPGASHLEVVAEAARAKPNISVILTSAYSQETIVGEMSSIRSFIRKPFQFRDLLNALQNA